MKAFQDVTRDVLYGGRRGNIRNGRGICTLSIIPVNPRNTGYNATAKTYHQEGGPFRHVREGWGSGMMSRKRPESLTVSKASTTRAIPTNLRALSVHKIASHALQHLCLLRKFVVFSGMISPKNIQFLSFSMQILKKPLTIKPKS